MNQPCRAGEARAAPDVTDTRQQRVVDKTETGDAATLINVAQRIRGAVGAIAVVAVIEQVDISTPGSAYQVAFGMLVVVSACALISATNMAASKQE
ncbi:hypothetical protein [Neoaquamicrobium sediminum]|jgi:hypothetical protein|uniref:hypothetical protein n=1 Tax=Neoaquamicrobium sediminum TaxID=1849104 RepID=UPI001567136C|nr:hypothetical protein [Mesorhizobium sediminum]NRC54311.1 hypothetical protein [Mesorhizobium sediminum]NRC56987.1 hypothetical protein [Mesorhizobium sediminum]NRC57405.1 hypothetical protein [Mesorhizobium sediminum]